MISCPTVEKRVIERHYDVSTLFYRLLWGAHIHHGLWHGQEPIQQAQLQLTDTLAHRGRVTSGMKVLDVGCGMGGSSIHLAKHYGCDVTGVTLSGLQRHWATWSSWLQGASGKTRFCHVDAERFQSSPEAFDLVWSIECTEHLFQKDAFFRRVGEWLRPGGRVAICAWLAGNTAGQPALEQQVYDVCEGFFCPSLGTMDDYVGWFRQAGLEMQVTEDWTEKVLQTWEICRRRVQQTKVHWIAPFIDKNAVMFLERFDTILNAYRSGAMRYGCLVAEKPAT
ncbi:MAG: class I SAM-dependent methyltransferase [Planctomycetales bacterium]|nr:class I SAM-dependent methyltransferase [Planctomycetales bacterium]